MKKTGVFFMSGSWFIGLADEARLAAGDNIP